jgi:hypothetical protein
MYVNSGLMIHWIELTLEGASGISTGAQRRAVQSRAVQLLAASDGRYGSIIVNEQRDNITMYCVSILTHSLIHSLTVQKIDYMSYRTCGYSSLLCYYYNII